MARPTTHDKAVAIDKFFEHRSLNLLADMLGVTTSTARKYVTEEIKNNPQVRRQQQVTDFEVKQAKIATKINKKYGR